MLYFRQISVNDPVKINFKSATDCVYLNGVCFDLILSHRVLLMLCILINKVLIAY